MAAAHRVGRGGSRVGAGARRQRRGAAGRAAVAVHDHAGWPVQDGFGPVTANVGVLRGGVQPNVVPDSAEMYVDLRTVPSVDPQALRDLVGSLAAPA